MKTSKTGITLIQHYEGLHDGDKKKPLLQPQMDYTGIWTVGWGHALTDKVTGKFLKGIKDYSKVEKQYPEFLNLTEEQAEELLKKDLQSREIEISRKLKVPFNQSQFDALMSFVYSCGYSDTLFRLINEKNSISKIVDWWQTHYITSGGKIQNGRIKRRKSEAHLFETGELKFY
jgi:lysozyme